MTTENIWHKMAVDKQWHTDDEMGPDGTPSARQRIAWAGLMLTEWAEYDEKVGELNWEIVDGKPEGTISELVDVWIRGADTLGACGEPVDGEVAKLCPEFSSSGLCYCIAKAMEACRTGDHALYAARIRGAMSWAQRYAWQTSALMTREVPWDEALRIKTEYNATRPPRHGGKLA